MTTLTVYDLRSPYSQEAMKKKNSAAVRLGRIGGKKRAKNMTAKERREAASKAAVARWSKEKGRVR